MNRIRAIKCCSSPEHAVVVCHMATHAGGPTPINHVRACQPKKPTHQPDTSPCRSRDRDSAEELHA